MGITYADPDRDSDEHTIQIAALTPADNAVIIGNGTAWTAESGATLRASLGLAIGSDVMAYDADLNDWAGVSPSNYLTTAAAAAAYQPLDSDLTAWAAVNPSSYSTTAQIAAAYQPLDSDLTSISALTTTSYGRALLTLADQTALRSAVGTIGDVTGPGSSTSGNVPTFSGTTGKLLQDSGYTINQSLATSSGPTFAGVTSTGAVAVSRSFGGSPDTFANYTVTLTGSDAGAFGPYLGFYHDSASPAANDVISAIGSFGKNASGTQLRYAQFGGQIIATTAGAESAQIYFNTIRAGSFGTRFAIGHGLYDPAATGGDLGSGTVNVAGGLYVNNSAAMTRGAAETVTGAKRFSSTVDAAADPASSFQIDFTNAATFTIANAANAGIGTTAFSGVIILHDAIDGLIGLYLVGAGVTYKIGGAAKYVSSSAPASGEVGVQYDGVDRYRIYNNQGSSRTLYVSLMRTRPAV